MNSFEGGNIYYDITTLKIIGYVFLFDIIK